ncbi:hypothetical protein RYX36_002636 [Vicia faba]
MASTVNLEDVTVPGIPVFEEIAMNIITYGPSNIKFRETDASLTKFNLASNNTLDYKLESNITARNSYKSVEVYYRRVTVIAWYKDLERNNSD